MAGSERGAIVGWDVGGAHLKACLLHDGGVADVAQWACPLWQGVLHLEHALQQAQARWPQCGRAVHAVTMTGEMTDLFDDREDGVRRIAALLSNTLAPDDAHALRFFAGARQWCSASEVGTHWQQIASANWRATATHAASVLTEGVLVDIGSTTTDLIAFRNGRMLGSSRTDAERLASGELVYHGAVRTPLCALGPRVAWQGAELNVMNELFATTADVYRLTGELNPAHDLHPSADNAPKNLPSTRRRLARMIGLDARDASAADWLGFAQVWRGKQVAELASQLQRVTASHHLSPNAVALSAGCGDFLVPDLLAHTALPLALKHYGRDVAGLATATTAAADTVVQWAQVCAPSVAVAMLFHQEQH